MIIAIAASYNDEKIASIRGNGKTMSAVFFAYQQYKEGKTIYTNFQTTFSKKVTINELITLFKNDKLSNTTIILDEAQLYLMNSGVKAGVIKELINLFIAQTRKREIDIFLTTQRYKNLNNKLRIHCDIILIPVKYHIQKNKLTSVCNSDTCKQPHAICIYNIMTQSFLSYILDPEKIGILYNSNEIVLDEFKLKKEIKK